MSQHKIYCFKITSDLLEAVIWCDKIQIGCGSKQGKIIYKLVHNVWTVEFYAFLLNTAGGLNSSSYTNNTVTLYMVHNIACVYVQDSYIDKKDYFRRSKDTLSVVLHRVDAVYVEVANKIENVFIFLKIFSCGRQSSFFNLLRFFVIQR